MAENPEETAYYLRLVSMYIDLGTTTVVSAFIHHSPDKDADTFLAGKSQVLHKLKRNKILNKQECELVFTLPHNVNNFDISLLIKLMINLFSKEQLTPPKKGWNNPPRNADESIAADLLRLRKIRNVIVGHRSEAVLPKWLFDNVWENVQQILLRIQHGICPGDEDRLKRRIEDYKLQTLDPCVQNRHDNILRGWHDDVSELQAEVEDLVTKLNVMDVYLKDKSDRYERYIMLLVKGGRLVLSNFLEHELKRQKKDLRKVIQDKERFFKNITNSGHVDTLYPHESNSAQQFDTSTWDAMLLAVVLLQVIDCNCENETKLAIESISNAEKNYADAVILSLSSDAFSDYVVDLKYSINVLSRFLENDKKSEIEKILEECKSNPQNSQTPQACFEELTSRGIQLKSIADTFAETLKKTKDHLQQMMTHGIDFKNEHVLELKMITLGMDEEKNKLAETILTQVWSEAINRSDTTADYQEVKKEVVNILEEIRKQRHVKNVSIKPKCILLQITCSSPAELLNLINYFESGGFKGMLGNISKEMGYIIDTVFSMHANLTLESLHELLSDSPAECPQQDQLGIILPITVSSPAGMMELRSFLKSGTITNSAHAIAASLSKHLGDTISLNIQADMTDLQSVFDNTVNPMTSLQYRCNADGAQARPTDAKPKAKVSNPYAMSEKLILDISKQIERDWYALRICLDFTEAQGVALKAAHGNRLQQCTHVMLKAWHDVVVECGENPRMLLAAAFVNSSKNYSMADQLVPRDQLNESASAKPTTVERIESIMFCKDGHYVAQGGNSMDQGDDDGNEVLGAGSSMTVEPPGHIYPTQGYNPPTVRGDVPVVPDTTMMSDNPDM